MICRLRPVTSVQLVRMGTEVTWRNWVLDRKFATIGERERLVRAMRAARASDQLSQIASWPVGDPPRDLIPLVDLGKAWHAIHFLLAGDPWKTDGGPEARAILGGMELEHCEMTYGPARAHDFLQVLAVARALTAIQPNELRARFDSDALAANKIYPEGWTNAGFDGAGWIVDQYTVLRSLYGRVADAGDSLVLWLG
jgi:hypothetical protein